MLSNKLAFAALAVACIAAAAGGGYLASRQNTVPAPASAQTQPATTVAPAPVPAATAPAERPVQETEAIVADKSAASTASKRTEKPRDVAKSARAMNQEAPKPASPSSVAAAVQPPVTTTPTPAVIEPPAQKPEERAA